MTLVALFLPLNILGTCSAKVPRDGGDGRVSYGGIDSDVSCMIIRRPASGFDTIERR